MQYQALPLLVVVLLTAGPKCVSASRRLQGDTLNSTQTSSPPGAELSPSTGCNGTTAGTTTATAVVNCTTSDAQIASQDPSQQPTNYSGIGYAPKQGNLLTFLVIIFGTFVTLLLGTCALSWRQRLRAFRREQEISRQLAEREADLLQKVPQPIVVIMPDKQIMSARKVEEKQKGQAESGEDDEDEWLKRLGPQFHSVDISVHSLRDISVRSGRALSAMFRSESKKQLGGSSAATEAHLASPALERAPSQCLSATVDYDSGSEGEEGQEEPAKGFFRAISEGSREDGGSSVERSVASSSKGSVAESDGEGCSRPPQE